MTALLAAELGPEWASASEAAPAVVLFLPGYGSDKRDLTVLAPDLGLALPRASLRAGVRDFVATHAGSEAFVR